MTDSEDSPLPIEVAFRQAAEMEKQFYTRTEIADAFETVAEELRPAR